MKFLLLPSVVLILCSVSGIESLSCACGLSPCEFPQCCDSGYYTSDICACCQTCAKGKGESCGGPWNSEGTCGVGLSCLRACECKTVEGVPCIFPFKYKGVEYNECTIVNSENDKAWCAIQVDEDGEVVKNQWKDCAGDCPGAEFPCQGDFLFNLQGTCVTDAERKVIEESNNDGISFEFNDGETNETQTIATCAQPDDGTKEKKACECARDIPKGEDGNCREPNNRFSDSDYAKGWCWLGYVDDPNNPQNNCYEDVQWSEANGRFWSNRACIEETQKIIFDESLLIVADAPSAPEETVDEEATKNEGSDDQGNETSDDQGNETSDDQGNETSDDQGNEGSNVPDADGLNDGSVVPDAEDLNDGSVVPDADDLNDSSNEQGKKPASDLGY